MIKTREQILFPKRERAKARMKAHQEKTFPFKISVWDSREKRTTRIMTFQMNFEAQNYLNTFCIKRNNRYYHKGETGLLDMELEYTLKNN